MPDFSIEDNYPNKVAIGVDEAGRGPLCGPVVAGAVILNRENYPINLNDSKKLSIKKREEIFENLIKNSQFGVGIIDSNIIDEINILQATKKAMQLAVLDLIRKYNLSKLDKIIIVDGNQKFNADEIEVLPVIKGDEKSLSISAASIIAKVTRDNLMKELHFKFPDYNWLKNAGYGTKQHLEAIEKYGITSHHRKSFEPIKSISTQ